MIISNVATDFNGFGEMSARWRCSPVLPQGLLMGSASQTVHYHPP